MAFYPSLDNIAHRKDSVRRGGKYRYKPSRHKLVCAERMVDSNKQQPQLTNSVGNVRRFFYSRMNDRYWRRIDPSLLFRSI